MESAFYPTKSVNSRENIELCVIIEFIFAKKKSPDVYDSLRPVKTRTQRNFALKSFLHFHHNKPGKNEHNDEEINWFFFFHRPIFRRDLLCQAWNSWNQFFFSGGKLLRHNVCFCKEKNCSLKTEKKISIKPRSSFYQKSINFIIENVFFFLETLARSETRNQPCPKLMALIHFCKLHENPKRNIIINYTSPSTSKTSRLQTCRYEMKRKRSISLTAASILTLSVGKFIAMDHCERLSRFSSTS